MWNECREAFGLRDGERTEKLGFTKNPKGWDRNLTLARAEYEWLREGSVKVQQQAIRAFRDEVSKYFTNRKNGLLVGFPGFRSRFDDTRSFKVAAPWEWRESEGSSRWAEVRIPKVGWVRFRLQKRSRDPYPRLPHGAKSYTVVTDRTGQWWVCFPVTINDTRYVHEPTGSSVGVDPGVASTYTDSTDRRERISTLTEGERRRKLRLERRAARQVRVAKRTALAEGRKAREWVRSERYEDTRRELARINAALSNRRTDWVERLTTDLVRTHDHLGWENTSIRNLVRSARGSIENPGVNVRAKSALTALILASRWGETRSRAEEKAAKSRGSTTFTLVPAPYSSQRCNACKQRGTRQRQAEFVCDNAACALFGVTQDADVNASLNHEDEMRRVNGFPPRLISETPLVEGKVGRAAHAA